MSAVGEGGHSRLCELGYTAAGSLSSGPAGINWNQKVGTGWKTKLLSFEAWVTIPVTSHL